MDTFKIIVFFNRYQKHRHKDHHKMNRISFVGTLAFCSKMNCNIVNQLHDLLRTSQSYTQQHVGFAVECASTNRPIHNIVWCYVGKWTIWHVQYCFKQHWNNQTWITSLIHTYPLRAGGEHVSSSLKCELHTKAGALPVQFVGRPAWKATLQQQASKDWISQSMTQIGPIFTKFTLVTIFLKFEYIVVASVIMLDFATFNKIVWESSRRSNLEALPKFQRLRRSGRRSLQDSKA